MTQIDSSRPELRKVLFVNSGNFHLAELDLRQPTHMHGGNNAGKTTIVNALQFAFIDKFGSMVWDEHGSPETRQHYFKQFSSIVFEVNTPSGFQCLVIHGLGPGSAFKYERWVYSGSLEPSKYYSENKGVISPVDTADLKLYLAGMDARKLNEKDVEKWVSGRGESPFSVAPLKRAADFESYRTVFTNLLRLKAIKSDKIRQLLVICSDVITDEINLRDKYQERYDEFSGKLQHLKKLEEAKPAIEKCVNHSVSLSEVRREYSMKYNFLRSLARDESKKLINDRDSTQSEVDGFEENMQAIDKQLAEAQEMYTQSRTQLTQLESDITKESERINRLEKIALIDLTSDLSKASDDVKTLSASISRSTEEDLDSELKRILRSLDSVSAELDGKITLKRLIRDLTGADHESFNAWNLIINEDLTQRIEGEGFSIQEREELRSELLRIKSAIVDGSLNTSGISIPLGPLEKESPQSTSEQLKEIQSGLIRKKSSIEGAIEAREQNVRTQNKLDESKKLERELQDQLNELQNLKISKKNLASEKDRLQLLKEKTESLLQDQKSISESRDSLLKKSATLKSDLEKLENELKSIQLDMERLYEPSHDWAERDSSPIEGSKWSEYYDIVETLNVNCKRKYTILRTQLDNVHALTDGQFRQDNEAKTIDSMKVELESMSDERIAVEKLQESLAEGLKGDIRDFMTSFEAIRKKASSFNRSFKQVEISDLDWFKIEVIPADSGLIQAMKNIRAADTLMSYVENEGNTGSLDSLFEHGKISLEQTFSVNVKVSVSGKVKKYNDLERFESQGTSLAVKLCFHVEILRSMMKENRGELPIFLDEVEKLDDSNLKGIIDYCKRLKFNIITASPRPSSSIDVNYWLDRSGFILQRHKSEWGEEDE